MKLSDLKPGMFVERYGLILTVVQNPDEFWTDSGHIEFIDSNDAYHGRCSAGIPVDQEFSIRYEEGTEPYSTAVHDMIQERLQSVTDARTDVATMILYK